MPTLSLEDCCLEGLITLSWMTPKRVVSSEESRVSGKVKLKIEDYFYKKVENRVAS